MNRRFVKDGFGFGLRIGLDMLVSISVCIAVGGAAIAASPAQPATPQLACDVSALQQSINASVTFINVGNVETNAQVTLQTAQSLATPAPASTPYCRIDGTIITEPKNVNDVKFQVSMPTQNFNGRYFQAGQGGFGGGSVQPPSALRLNEGFVSASTDRGGAVGLGITGLCDPCGFHIAAIAAQRVTKAFYGTSSLVRYVVGCSGGGSDGRGNVLEYGAQDFDGVVTGANPFGWGLVLGYGRVGKYLSEHPEGNISPALLAQAEAAILARYDGTDGAVDGVVQDDRNFRLDEQVLRDVGFTDAQIATIHFVNSLWHVDAENNEVVSPDGTYVGFPIGRLSQWSAMFGFGRSVFESIMLQVDPTFDFDAYTFDEMAELFVNSREAISLDYSAFRDGGGKLLHYTGAHDGLVTYFDALLWRRELTGLEAAPANKNLDNWFRLFVVQGMDHCGGPNGPSDAENRFFEALIGWVENGSKPGSVLGNRPASPTRPARTFLMCSEPYAPVYNGAGNVNDAANWTCVNKPRNSACGDTDWSPLKQCSAKDPGEGVSFEID